MTQSASPGIGFAFAVQSAKGAPVTNPALFKKQAVLQAQLGPVEGYDQFGTEVNGVYHPGGLFKTYNVGMGSVRMYPRLEGDIGYLLYALLGAATAAGASTAQGVFTTTFTPAADIVNHPWLTARRWIYNTAGALDHEGQEISDAKLAGMTLTLGAGGVGMMDLGLLAITPSSAADASGWGTSMTDAFETTASAITAPNSLAPIFKAVTGIDMGDGVATDFNVPTLGLRLGVANTFSGSDIRSELKIGSYSMDDQVLMQQSASFELTYKWKDPKLFRSIYYHGHNAYTWSPTVLETEVQFPFRGPRLIGSTNTYEQLNMNLKHVSLQCPEGIQQIGGGFLTMRVVGICRADTTAAGYMEAVLINGTPYSDLGVSYT
jgi:hypothetical protein